MYPDTAGLLLEGTVGAMTGYGHSCQGVFLGIYQILDRSFRIMWAFVVFVGGQLNSLECFQFRCCSFIRDVL